MGLQMYCKSQLHWGKITRVKSKLQWNSVVTNSVVNKHSVITNRIWSQIGNFSTQINPVLTNPDYNEQKWTVPRCSL